MLDQEVQKFQCFNHGWVSALTKSKIDIDLSKFEWGKGYAVAINGATMDPLFGAEMPIRGRRVAGSQWIHDYDFIQWLAQKHGVDGRLKDEVYDKSGFENKFERMGKSWLEDLVKDLFKSLLHNQGFALCGVTDDSYFTNLVIAAGLQDEHIVYLG